MAFATPGPSAPKLVFAYKIYRSPILLLVSGPLPASLV